MNPEQALAEAIAKAVAEHRVNKVPLEVVRTAAASVDRTAASTVGWPARLLAAIALLVEEGRVSVPKTKLDTRTTPPLPAYLIRPSRPRVAPIPADPVIWHVDLTWAALADEAGELSAGERQFLARINAWLPRRRGIVVPLRERSLDIFGDDKTLERWLFGPLFGDDKLTLELLECELCLPPVQQTVLGPGDWLIIENYTTYVSISRRAASGFDGRIVWGSGNQVGTRLTALAAAGESPPRCWYFGDIDTGGFRAARLAHTRATELGLGPILPARGLYRLAVQHGLARRTRGSARPGADLLTWIHSWLGGTLGDTAAAITGAGDRIVQENVGTEVLSTAPPHMWLEDPARRNLSTTFRNLSDGDRPVQGS